MTSEELMLESTAPVVEAKEAAKEVMKAAVEEVVEEVEEEEEEEISAENVSEYLAQGTQFYATGNYEGAVEKFAIATEALSVKYGQTAPECAEVLYLYGKALLANAVAKNALSGEGLVKAVEKHEGESSSKGKEKMEEDDDEGTPLAEVDLGEETDDLELAWESLDLARIIFSKMETEADKLKLADVYLALGDTSLESGKFIK
jgi:HAT1-interacting factor 1